ncbi:hypothetical protein B0O99DRAFT_589975 [Bisporella sp. PMI_857]|nr:hypothetical protein B0O99DRAFT_371202 [Bisporella sp. PMI_857]KAH8600295.1 hypothetical protein B0O99DRAFT_589975 [Bisporella sp. PMI_857]
MASGSSQHGNSIVANMNLLTLVFAFSLTISNLLPGIPQVARLKPVHPAKSSAQEMCTENEHFWQFGNTVCTLGPILFFIPPSFPLSKLSIFQLTIHRNESQPGRQNHQGRLYDESCVELGFNPAVPSDKVFYFYSLLKYTAVMRQGGATVPSFKYRGRKYSSRKYAAPS